LDPAQLKATEPHRTFLAASDTQAAWTGVWPGTKYPLRVEAAALRGKPVAFALMGPWSGTSREPASDTGEDWISFSILAGLFIVLVGGSTLLARANLKKNRGDKRGAFRLAIFIFYAQMALWICRGHFTFSQGLFGMLVFALATSTFVAAVVWGVYIALEPSMRRRFPQMLIGWSAVLTGRFRDPIVGRDVLLGIAGGVWLMALARLWNDLHTGAAGSPGQVSLAPLMGLRGVLASCMILLPAVRNALLFLFLLFLVRLLLRSAWLAAAAFGAIFSLLTIVANHSSLADASALFLAFSITALILLRLGLLTVTALMFANNVVSSATPTLNVNAWYFANSVALLCVVAALAFWAMRTSTGGRRLFQSDLFG
jgi:serine/threonine-protein kinase